MLDKIPSIRGLELYCAAKPSTDIKKTLKKIDLKKDLKKSQRSLRPCDLGISSSTFQPPFLLANHLRPKPSPVRHSNLSHFARLESIIILPKLASFQHLEFLPIVSQYSHCSLCTFQRDFTLSLLIATHHLFSSILLLTRQISLVYQNQVRCNQLHDYTLSREELCRPRYRNDKGMDGHFPRR